MAEADLNLSVSSNNSSNSRSDSESEGDYAVVTSHAIAYADEPLARPGQSVQTNDTDEDGLSPLTLEMRSDGRILINEWCICKCCRHERLVGIREHRCCREMIPVVRILTLGGGEEPHHGCITQHEDFSAMINATVLEQVGPLFKDRNGRSYRNRGGQTRNEYLRAVAYRWLIRWLCGLLGWDNSRPLPACVYNNIRTQFPTQEQRGYISAQTRS